MEENNFYFNEKNYVTTKEAVYETLAIILSVLLYLILIASIIGFIYVLIFVFAIWIEQALLIAYIKQNSVKISQEQFKEIDDKISDFTYKMHLAQKPQVYLMQSSGILNSFATRFMFKDYVILYSDVMELAYESGEDAVDFIIAHEMAHVCRKHMSKRKWTIGSFLFFPLYFAYSRACETTCDNIAKAFVPNNATDGLLLLAAGKKLYKKVNIPAFIQTTQQEYGFWAWWSEICSTHPHLSKRVKNLTVNN